MLKTILIIILSVTFFGVLFFIFVKNSLKKKLEDLVKNEKNKNSNNFDQLVKFFSFKIKYTF